MSGRTGSPRLVTRAASKIRVGSEEGLTPISDFGFVMLDLRLGTGAVDPLFHGSNQSHVSTMHRAEGRFGGLTTAWPINSSDIPYVDPPIPRLSVNQFQCLGGWLNGLSSVRNSHPRGARAGGSASSKLLFGADRQFPARGDRADHWAAREPVGRPATRHNQDCDHSAVCKHSPHLWIGWGYHEVVAPFADFEILFFVPGGSPALSQRFVVHYAGTL